MKLQEILIELRWMASNHTHARSEKQIDKIGNHLDMARTDLRRFLDERELSVDAVEEIEEIIKCLE